MLITGIKELRTEDQSHRDGEVKGGVTDPGTVNESLKSVQFTDGKLNLGSFSLQDCGFGVWIEIYKDYGIKDGKGKVTKTYI